MSFQTFMASDSPMEEVTNPHIKLLSINEALKQGISLSDMVLNSSTIDRDKPGVVLWVDNEENLGEITIQNEEKAYLGRNDSLLETDLQFFSILEWHYTKERAKKLITYIREHLKKATEMEIWNLWIGYEETIPKTKKLSIGADELTVAVFERMFYNGQPQDTWQQYDCLSIKRIK